MDAKRPPKKKAGGTPQRGKQAAHGHHAAATRREGEEARAPDAADQAAHEPREANAPRRARRLADRFPIVGIGASAGGLQALQAFFAEVPADSGAGFVVITHTRPERHSLLPELIANVTKLPVISTAERTRVVPNQIIIAKDSLLSIFDGVLTSAKHDEHAEHLYHPIDHFFRELAQDQHAHAIGVILSGSGDDGALGLKAIKAAGGMVMVQEPASAKFTSMPERAIASVLADYVLPPPQLPDALLRYTHAAFSKNDRERDAALLPEDAINTVLVCLRAHSGHDFTCYKRSTMARRIGRRMNVQRVDSPETYIHHLRDDPHERDALVQELLISVTSFFRDPHAFEALARTLPKLLDTLDEGQTVRVWIPGCATGEEAYSVAMLLHEHMRKVERHQSLQVFATDLDARAIERARSGIYPEAVRVELSAARLTQYFAPHDQGYRIRKPLRDMVVFATQNVISDPPFTRINLIVCRNLLIYLDVGAQQRVLHGFHYALRPAGMLFLGLSETLGAAADLFHTLDAKHKILQRRDTDRPVHPALFAAHHGTRETRETPPTTAPAGRDLSRGIERLLLDRFAPCSVVVDDRGAIVYLHGRCEEYLQPEQGRPRNKLAGMVRNGLGAPLARCLAEAREEHQDAVRRNLRVQTPNGTERANLTVRPLHEPESLRGLLLVTIEAAKPEATPSASAEAPPGGGGDHADLERELNDTRESLQSTIGELEFSNEELKSSSEELQSTNEEMHSANEELETSREELQSLNEELNTLNAELEAKIDALSRINDDMHNLLNSTQIATIFLDTDLRVRRYTAEARDVIRLIDADIGRPLSDLTSNIDYETLIEDCEKVLATLAPRHKEVLDADQHWRLVRVLPYRTADNVIDGVVITVLDIDRMKRAELEANAAQAFFESVVQTVRTPLIVLDAGLRVVRANAAFYRTFAWDAVQSEGVLLYEIDDHQWNIAALRKLLEEILPTNTAMNDFLVEHTFPRIGHRRFLLNARRLERNANQPALILLAFEDVTQAPA